MMCNRELCVVCATASKKYVIITVFLHPPDDTQPPPHPAQTSSLFDFDSHALPLPNSFRFT